MQQYKRDFIEFMVRSDVLTFGDFTTKSGRRTPFFINTGRYRTGEQLAQLGEFYAAAIDESWPDGVDILFGPAYKGIPLVATASIGLAARGRSIGYLFNRKEAKDHGEGGQLVGAEVTGRVLLVDDVLTSGKAIRQSVDLIAQTDAEIVGTVIALDRAELVAGAVTAVEALANDLQAPIVSIASVADIIERLADAADLTLRQRMLDYQQQYCRMS